MNLINKYYGIFIMNLLHDLKIELVSFFEKNNKDFSLKKYISSLSKPQKNHEINYLLERYINILRRQFSFQKPKNVFISKELQEK